MTNRVEIFDTTLRDGEQSPGASMDEHQKIEVAQQLERLGVDVIEAGFPIASEQEFESVKKVAELIKGPRIAALARTSRPDIERAAPALQHAERPVLHPSIATPPIPIEHKLQTPPCCSVWGYHISSSLATGFSTRACGFIARVGAIRYPAAHIAYGICS